MACSIFNGLYKTIKRQNLKKLINLIFFLSMLTSFSQNEIFMKGSIIDSVFINDKSGESFALYLPAKYDSSINSPIVFIFDPAARGKTGIEPFIRAAEEYGYILICSNDSKNGPYNINYDIANRLFSKVLNQFKIDEKKNP